MSRIRTNLITNRMANGAPTVSHGLVVAGVTTVTGSINNLNLTGITTISTLDLNGDLDVDGHLNADNVSIAGVITATSYRGDGSQLTGIAAGLSTISGVVNVANDLDVDGHTNLDNVSVAGVTTFSGAINSSANITTTLDLNSRYLYVKDIFMEDVSPELRFIDSDNNPNYRIRLNSGLLGIRDITNNVDKLVFNTSGMVATGIVTATSFSGSGANLTDINTAASYNAVINGEMLVSQRGSDWTSVGSSAYHLDRWYWYDQNSSCRVRIRHSADSPDGFHQSYRVNVTTADTSIASNEEVKLFHKIEGYNLAPFAKGTSGAKRFTLSFYVKCNKTGTYCVELYDRDNGRDVSGSYTVSNTNWNRYTIDFPADTTGEFGFDNGSSLEIIFWLVAGSAVQGGSLNTSWRNSSDPSSATGQVNFTDSTSNEWMLTGVQLEPTTTGTASDFKHEDVGTTLLKCKRYYQRSTDSSRGTNYSLSSSSWHSADGVQSFCKHNNYYDFKERFEVEMRAAPTLTIYGSTTQGDIHIERVAVGSQEVDWNNNTTEVRTKGFLLRHIEDSYGTSGSGNGFGILAYTVDAEL